MTMNLEDAIELARAEIENCLLCGASAAPWLAIFLPADPSRFVGKSNPAPANTRGIFYRLCNECKREPNVSEIVEERMTLH